MRPARVLSRPCLVKKGCDTHVCLAAALSRGFMLGWKHLAYANVTLELYRRRDNICICAYMYLKGITWLLLSSECIVVDFFESVFKYSKVCYMHIMSSCQATYMPLKMIGVNVEFNVDFAHIHCRSCTHNHWVDLLSFLL